MVVTNTSSQKILESFIEGDKITIIIGEDDKQYPRVFMEVSNGSLKLLAKKFFSNKAKFEIESIRTGNYQVKCGKVFIKNLASKHRFSIDHTPTESLRLYGIYNSSRN